MCDVPFGMSLQIANTLDVCGTLNSGLAVAYDSMPEAQRFADNPAPITDTRFLP